MMQVALARLLAIITLFSSPSHVAAEGEEICIEGFIIDTYCLAVGFFPHTTTRALHAPAKHSVHCLIDDANCINSGFEVLADKQADFVAGSSTSPYCRAYKLDDAGRGMMIDLAKSTGVCDDCNEDTTGEHVNAFRAMVKGTVSTPATETLPAVIAVTSVEPASDGIGCDESGSSIPQACIAERSDLVDGQAPCWDEDKGCVNLDDPFARPAEEEPLNNEPNAKSAGSMPFDAYGRVVARFVVIALVLGSFAMLV